MQKRGLPYGHISITLYPEDSLKTAELVEKSNSAKIPEYNLDLKN